MRHQRWLSAGHPFREQSEEFDGTKEREGPPILQSGEDILRDVEGIIFSYGKAHTIFRKRAREEQFTCC